MGDPVKGVGRRVSRFVQTDLSVFCPGFYTLHWARGCPFSCSYCFLQRTFARLKGGKAPHAYDEEEVLAHADRWLRHIPFPEETRDRPALLNAGELADSLALRRSSLSTLRSLVYRFTWLEHNPFRRRLLLVSKVGSVARAREVLGDEVMVGRSMQDRVIVSATLNAPEFVQRFERGTPPIEKRLAVLAWAKERGFPIRVRVDPLWKYDYGWLASRLRELAPEVVTLGSFRMFGQDFKRMGLEGLKPDLEKCGDKRWRPKARLRWFCDLSELLPGIRVGLCKEPVDTLFQWEWETRRDGKASCNCLPT